MKPWQKLAMAVGGGAAVGLIIAYPPVLLLLGMVVVVGFLVLNSEADGDRQAVSNESKDMYGVGLDEIAAGERSVEELRQKELRDEELRQRILEANARLAKWNGREPSPLEERLVRGERSPAEWLADLRRAAQGAEHSFRAPQVPNEELWSIVEDTSAHADARVAAAIALGPTLTEDERARLRVATEACESRKVRVAIGAAADGVDEDELAEALADLED